ncbi:MAG: DNA-3-methyladenine glycosylase [Bacteroidetes bacterium]|nr:DNA-3-methyladenine glycosylase [Bacteroidota bacterium]
MAKPVAKNWYLRSDVVQLAQEVLGKRLLTTFNGQLTSGIITEAEAYAGETDKASHAWNGRRTARTEPMYAEGGVAYVYLCYGIHHLFNIVTNVRGVPHAILIRGIQPEQGIETMQQRRKNYGPLHKLAAGPGTVSQALGIHTSHTGMSLRTGEIRLEETGLRIAPAQLIAGPRVGVDYAADHALLPWRFRIKGGSLSIAAM